MRPDLVVMPAPLLDSDLGLDAVPKPLQAQVLVPELAVERLVGRILPWLPRVDVRGLDLRVGEPPQDGRRDELRSIVRAQIAWRAVQAHQLREDLDDAPGSN